MPKFVVYEVWTRSTVIDTPDDSTTEDVILSEWEPEPVDGMDLCNWHVVGVDQED